MRVPMTAPATAPPVAQAELSIEPRPAPARPPIAVQIGQFPWLSGASPVLEVVTQPERTLLTKRMGVTPVRNPALMVEISRYTGCCRPPRSKDPAFKPYKPAPAGS